MQRVFVIAINRPMYTPSPTSSHALGVSRSSLHHAVAASYPNPLESYPNAYFVGATAYSPPTPAQPLLSPKQPIGSITSQNNNNTSISAQSVLSSKCPPSGLTELFANWILPSSLPSRPAEINILLMVFFYHLTDFPCVK